MYAQDLLIVEFKSQTEEIYLKFLFKSPVSNRDVRLEGDCREAVCLGGL